MKRITKKQLQEQLEAAKSEKWDLEQRLHTTNEALAQSQTRLRRVAAIAQVRFDERPDPADQYTISMNVDRREWHTAGKGLLRDILVNMLSDISRQFAADALQTVDAVFEREDINQFLAEWLFVTIYYPLRMAVHMTVPSKQFWTEVISRLFKAMKALKEAGRDNYKVREGLMMEAHTNPIQL